MAIHVVKIVSPWTAPMNGNCHKVCEPISSFT